MTVELPPEEPALEPRRQRPPEPRQMNIALVAVIAFAFGVFLHGCVALSILDSGDGGSSVTTLPTPVPQVTVGVPAQDTPTPLPDRTSCSEIQGTQYRSATERQFYLANCLATATPAPTATSTPTPGP